MTWGTKKGARMSQKPNETGNVLVPLTGDGIGNPLVLLSNVPSAFVCPRPMHISIII